MFVNTLVLRTPVDAGASFADLLAHVRETDLGAFAHADVPFERLVEVLDPTRSTAYSPLFQVALEFQNNEQAAPRAAGPDGRGRRPRHSAWSKVDLELIAGRAVRRRTARPRVSPARSTTRPTCSTPRTVARFADRFVRILDAVDRRPATGRSATSRSSTTTRRGDWHRSAAPASVAPASCWPELLPPRPALDPSGRAVLRGRERLTYRELDERSNRLARVLIDRGVGPETFVALGMPRSIESVLAIWAVAKTGAAFVPVDPSLPGRRIEHMLDRFRRGRSG